MGVTPALAAGAGGQREDDESREERERREFYELEMELLREEERGGGAAPAPAPAGGGGLDQHRQGGTAVVGSEGQQEQHHGDFWDDEREGLAEGLEFESAATSKAG